MKQIKLPKFLYRYFWESDVEALKSDENEKYIIERLLDRGNEKAISWLLKQYDKKTISEVVKHNRELSKKSLNYWIIVLGLEKWRQKLLAQKQKAIWSY